MGHRGSRGGSQHVALKHFTAPEFCLHYRQLPAAVQALADKNFALLKANERHTSVRFKRVGAVWSIRVGLHFRALGQVIPTGCSGIGLDRTALTTV